MDGVYRTVYAFAAFLQPSKLAAVVHVSAYLSPIPQVDEVVAENEQLRSDLQRQMDQTALATAASVAHAVMARHGGAGGLRALQGVGMPGGGMQGGALGRGCDDGDHAMLAEENQLLAQVPYMGSPDFHLPPCIFACLFSALAGDILQARHKTHQLNACP